MEEELLKGCDGVNRRFKREGLLNYGMGRWQLNYASSAGPVAELIRRCAPRKFEEWESFYFENAVQKKRAGQRISREYLEELGRKLYVKLSEVVQSELSSITEQECIDYVFNLVLNRTYEGYRTEVETVYGSLERELGRRIEPASDDWDRTYNVDFYIQIGEKYIGIQIKPVAKGKSINDYQWEEMHRRNHERFKARFGGEVFFVFSRAVEKKKEILNKEVILQIKAEIERLSI